MKAIENKQFFWPEKKFGKCLFTYYLANKTFFVTLIALRGFNLTQ